MGKRKSSSTGIRFSAGALRDEAGRTFQEGDDHLDRAAAARAARGRRVLVHWYHAPVEDITDDPGRIDQELDDLRLQPVLFKTTATLYRNGGDSVLVFERHH